MRRMAPVLAAAVLTLTAVPALAADEEEPMAGDAAVQHIDVPEVGYALDFPADWTVRTPTAPRISEIQHPDGEPVYVTTAIMANVSDGRWCDTDVYLDMPAPLGEHAAAYAIYLEQVHGAGIPVTVREVELPVGQAFNLEVVNEERERVWVKYLFDGPVAEDGTVDRFLLTCVAPIDAEPYWGAIAESVEVYEPVEPQASAAPEASMAPGASPEA
jgi:hypothetical protein